MSWALKRHIWLLNCHPENCAIFLEDKGVILIWYCWLILKVQCYLTCWDYRLSHRPNEHQITSDVLGRTFQCRSLPLSLVKLCPPKTFGHKENAANKNKKGITTLHMKFIKIQQWVFSAEKYISKGSTCGFLCSKKQYWKGISPFLWGWSFVTFSPHKDFSLHIVLANTFSQWKHIHVSSV